MVSFDAAGALPHWLPVVQQELQLKIGIHNYHCFDVSFM